MASRNAKSTNSSETETEWTFIDADDGTIVTRKDSVTYRKPTYSEILKGVVAEKLEQEVESEPEFEVLASFKFRPKGESFGLGSSAPKDSGDPKSKEKGSKHEAEGDEWSSSGDDSGSSDDGIMIISSHFEPEKAFDDVEEANEKDAPCQAANDGDECNGSEKMNRSINPDDCCNDLDDTVEFIDDKNDGDETVAIKKINDEDVDDDKDDDDFVIADDPESDFEEDNEPNDDDEEEEDDDDGDDVESEEEDTGSDEKILTESTCNIDENLNESAINESPEQPLNKENHELETSDEPEDTDSGLLGLYKGGICDNPSKDLAWDSFTFQFLSNFPRMSESATSVDDDDTKSPKKHSDIDIIQDSDDENSSGSSYVAISQDDKHDDTTDSSSFEDISESADVDSSIFGTNLMIPRWLFDANYKGQDLAESFDNDTDDINSDLEEISFEKTSPIVPCWLFDANYKVEDLDKSFGDYTDYSDSEFESDSDIEDFNSISIPRWLFDQNFKHPEKDEEGFFSSHLFVDMHTFIILLCLTTALGFSIGHGLTIYFSGQALSRNTKLQDSGTPQSPFQSPLEEIGLTAEEVAKIDLLKLEDEIYRQKETEVFSGHLRFDLRELYKRLQEKHYRLLRDQKSTEDRLHISKTMSWFWRLKFDEEKRRNLKTKSPTTPRERHNNRATLAKEREFANKWMNNQFMKSNLKWLVNPLEAKLKRQKEVINKTKAELAKRYWLKAITLSKNTVMKDFKRRWTQDFKELKRKSCSHSSHVNKSNVLEKKPSSIVLNPFVWVNNSRNCKRADKNDIIGRSGPLLKKRKNSVSKVNKRFGKKANFGKFKPCFSKRKNDKEDIILSDDKSVGASLSVTKVPRKPRKGESARSTDRYEEIRREKMKKRELKNEALEIKTQVYELKLVLSELRRERRKAEKEKAILEASWRKLKRQRLLFEKEREEQKKSIKKKVRSKLEREKTRLNAWKKVAKKAQKKAQSLHNDLERLTLDKRKMKDVENIKKELKLEKRKLRKQQKNLKSVKQQLRQERRDYARERWKTKKRRRELEKQARFQPKNLPSGKKMHVRNKGKARNRFKEKNQREQDSTKSKREKNRGQNDQKRYWEDLEKRLYEWAQQVNRTVERAKENRIWKKIQKQFRKLIDWTTRKTDSKPTGPVKKKSERYSKKKAKIKSSIYERVLAEQMKFDKEKRNAKKDSENQWKSKSPTFHKKRKSSDNIKTREKKKEKKDPEVLLRQRRRKQRRKYQRELERLQQWALQMNEKKLEHERIYREKKKNPKCIKARRNVNSETEKGGIKETDGFSNNRALVSLEESNNTLMLLLKPRVSGNSYEEAKPYKREMNSESLDERIILSVTKSQQNHDLSEKKSSDTSLTLPIHDDIIHFPNDKNKVDDSNQNPFGVSSFGRDELTGSAQPIPPSLGPTFYEELPILKIMGKIDPKKEHPVDAVGSMNPENLVKDSRSSDDDVKDQQTKPWYMRRAEQRDVFRNSNPSLTWLPRPGPLKSDGTWFFHRSSDRAVQRKLYEPLNKQNLKDGFKHGSRRSYFYRGGNRNKIKDGEWVFERASDRAEQRSKNEPWYMRRAEGREADREENKDSWFIERGYYRNQLHDYDEDDDDDDDDLLNHGDDEDDDDFYDHEDQSWF